MTDRSTESILAERATQHGSFTDNSRLVCALLRVARASPNGEAMVNDETINIGVFMILHKLARALSGDLRYADHWDDIAGYAKLVSKYVGKAEMVKKSGDTMTGKPTAQDEDANFTRLQYEKYERNQLRHQFPVETFESWLDHQDYV